MMQLKKILITIAIISLFCIAFSANIKFASAQTSVSLTFDAYTSGFTPLTGANYLTINGTNVATPYTFLAIVGNVYIVSANATVTQGTTRYLFNNWLGLGLSNTLSLPIYCRQNY